MSTGNRKQRAAAVTFIVGVFVLGLLSRVLAPDSMVSKFEAWHEAWRGPWEGLLYMPAFVLVLGQLIGWKAQSANKVLGRLAARTIEIGPVIVLGALFVVFGIDSEGH